MDDLIRRKALLESIERISVKGNVLDDDWVYRFIQEFPSAERNKGKWIYHESLDVFECSVCGEQMVRNIFYYCPWCGADMRERKKE